MKLRVLKAKLKVFSMRADILAKQLASDDIEYLQINKVLHG